MADHDTASADQPAVQDTLDDDLRDLCAQVGIQTEFWDWKGRHTTVSRRAVSSILTALGVPVETPEQLQAAVADARLAPWRRPLPVCTVIEAGQSRLIDVHVRAGHPARVGIRLEDGQWVELHQRDNDVADREVDRRMLGRATFALGEQLPLGYHQVVLDTTDESGAPEVHTAPLIVTPAFVGFPRSMGERRIWGHAAQLYSVRSEQSWGIGDLADLADLAIWGATQQGADYVLINPLHAAQPTAPMEPSPYLPSSRVFVNPLYLRPEQINEWAQLSEADRASIAAAQRKVHRKSAGQSTLKRDRSWKAKRKALEAIFELGLSTVRRFAFEGFIRQRGRALHDFAVWSALVEVYGHDWRTWPDELRRPDTEQVAAFAAANAQRVEFFCWLQWHCDQQLSQAQQASRDAGMAVGIISDLAVGVNPAGADTWLEPEVFAAGIGVGAPPDQFNQQGQNWGQPPWRPDRLAEQGYRPFRALVQAVLAHSGGVRIDHIIGLFRLWWVPEGTSAADGAYVRYDHEAMIGIVALEAYRAGALVIGEDLGTVEPWVREYLSRRGVLGTSVLWFEQQADGQPLPPEQWRSYCMASVTTHDLPPTTGYLAGDHVRLREELGLLTETVEDELAAADAEQRAVIEALRQRGLVAEGDDAIEETVLALHRWLMATPSRVLNVALTDAVGDRLTQNQPGTIDEYPNWRVPLSDPAGRPILLEDVYTSARARRLAEVMSLSSERTD